MHKKVGRHCCDQLMLHFQVLHVTKGCICDPENIQKAIGAGKYAYFITVFAHLTSSSLECNYAYCDGYCFLPVLETSVKIVPSHG
jgi:hypothetical protein